jgi:integrase
MLWLEVLTGLRCGDLLDLRWSNIDFSVGKISIVQQKTRRPLTIEMGPTLTSLLKSLPRYEGCPFVFSEDGHGLTQYGWMRTDFKLARRRAEIENFRFHDLRSTFASLLHEAGTSEKVINELLGHSSMRMTHKYIQVAQGAKSRAIEELAQKIGGLSPQRDVELTVLDTATTHDDGH